MIPRPRVSMDDSFVTPESMAGASLSSFASNISPIVIEFIQIQQQMLEAMMKAQLMPRSDGVQLPKYGGRANEDVFRWLEDINRVMDDENIDEEVKAKLARKQLVGEAHSWYYTESGLLDAELMEWPTIKTAIKIFKNLPARASRSASV